MSASSSSLRVGSLVARHYKLGDPYAPRGVGDAWHATRAPDNTPLELVVLHALRVGVSSEDARIRIGELRQVRHVHLARILDVVDHDGVAVVVYQAGDGITLDAWLEQRGVEDLATRFDALREMLDQLCHALGMAHRVTASRPYAHGALTSACIGIERRGESAFNVRIACFGLAELAHTSPQCEEPPEGNTPTPVGDVFAIGRLATALLTRRVFTSAAASDVAWWRDHAPQVHPSLAEVIASCMAAVPTSRPHDARELRERLRHAQWEPVDLPGSAPIQSATPRALPPAPVLASTPLLEPQRWMAPRAVAPPPSGALADLDATVVNTRTSETPPPAPLRRPRRAYAATLIDPPDVAPPNVPPPDVAPPNVPPPDVPPLDVPEVTMPLIHAPTMANAVQESTLISIRPPGGVSSSLVGPRRRSHTLPIEQSVDDGCDATTHEPFSVEEGTLPSRPADVATTFEVTTPSHVFDVPTQATWSRQPQFVAQAFVPPPAVATQHLERPPTSLTYIIATAVLLMVAVVCLCIWFLR